MDKQVFTEEQLNVRCFYLRLIKRLWLMLPAALCGAVLGIALYSAVTRATRPVVYESRTQLYLHFIENASGDKVYDYYNAYTWNDLIRTDAVRKQLENEAVKEKAREAFAAIMPGEDLDEESLEHDYLSGAGQMVRVEAQILSDIRVLWIVASSEAAEGAVANSLYMSLWMAHALEAYGAENEVFRSVEITALPQLSESEKPLTYPDRALAALVTGAALGALAGLFLLLVLHLLDEAVYVPEEAEKRYGLPVVAVLCGNGDLPALLRGEAEKNLSALTGQNTPVYVISADSAEEERAAAERGNALLPEKQAEGPLYPARGNTENKTGRALLALAAGKRNAALTGHVLSQARMQGYDVCGILLTNADGLFLKRYYRL